jgi:hypothetical protein
MKKTRRGGFLVGILVAVLLTLLRWLEIDPALVVTAGDTLNDLRIRPVADPGPDYQRAQLVAF